MTTTLYNDGVLLIEEAEHDGENQIYNVELRLYLTEHEAGVLAQTLKAIGYDNEALQLQWFAREGRGSSFDAGAQPQCRKTGCVNPATLPDGRCDMHAELDGEQQE